MIGGNATILETCATFERAIPSDFGGGSPLPKTFLMSYLVELHRLRSFVEIGVYRGRSLFPTAYAIHKNGGRSYGVDPYNVADALEYEAKDNLSDRINEFLHALDFEALYEDVTRLKGQCGFGSSIELIRLPSARAVSLFREWAVEIDLLHIDGNHDSRYVEEDYRLYSERVKDGGFVIFDDIDWPSVRATYDTAARDLVPVFETETFGILRKAPRSFTAMQEAAKLSRKLCSVYEKLLDTPDSAGRAPIIAIGVLAYNHGRYIEECLKSIVSQTGGFRMRVVICDDCSQDDTEDRVRRFLAGLDPSPTMSVEYIRNSENLGMTGNLEKLVNSLGPCDYFALCDGDDYYLSAFRLAEHLELHRRNPHVVVSFSKMLLRKEGPEDSFEVFLPEVSGGTLSTDDLIHDNTIGNLGVCFYDGRLLKVLPPDLFQVNCAEWFFNVFCSRYGELELLNKPLGVYRKHAGGCWTGLGALDRNRKLLQYIDEYNTYLDFEHDSSFTRTRNLCVGSIDRVPVEALDLAIIDDIFPHPGSGFRYQELTSILRELPRSKVYTTGDAFSFFGPRDGEELLVGYKRKFPQFGGQVQMMTADTLVCSRLLYGVFLGNAERYLVHLAEKFEIPFAFTLYPGGKFAFDNPESDDSLRRVMSSPFFRRVVVTNELVAEYLTDRKFCAAEQMTLIPGVVTPLELLSRAAPGKQRFGFDKERLDVCFVAHRYTPRGEDKGYDVFVAVARELSKRCPNVRFHVVGSFDESVLDVSDIPRISFYGVREQAWFDEFYRDKDLILSPTTCSKISPGSFDGFPTGCTTDAALRGVAMFCTDPLGINRGRIVEGEEIEIVPHDAERIVAILEEYYKNPDKLRDLAVRGLGKIRQLYSYEQQIEPRLQVLRELIQY